MGMLVFRDTLDGREYVGRIDRTSEGDAAFQYDRKYLVGAQLAEQLGISERLPLDSEPYSAEEVEIFFGGLLPEGEVMSELIRMYQLPRGDYLALLEQLGCESTGALTFMSERMAAREYVPEYTPLDSWMAESLVSAPVRATAQAVSDMRLSLSGTQAKVAWMLPEELSARSALLSDWLIPRGTAPSTHIIKVSRKGEEDLVLNELACSILANACSIDTAEVSLVDGLPGAIAVKRYDRIWIDKKNEREVVRLHQEDFCQALGLLPHFKYQPDTIERSYMRMAADLLENASENPLADKREFAKRSVFNFIIGNADAHLKNSSLLYNPRWTGCRLAPFYDAACVPLLGYSDKMGFDIGKHRYLHDVDEQDLASISFDLDIPLAVFKSTVQEVIDGFESFDGEGMTSDVAAMTERILVNSEPRLAVTKRFLDQ